MRPKKQTARVRLTEVLADEILSQASENVFGIESEHQLCRRFNVSRVTVRLALSDLQARGLIFRRQGKGTFAYGHLNRIRRSIGILLRTLPSAEEWPVLEIIRGFHHGSAALPANVSLIHASPREWSPQMVQSLGGVFVFPAGLAQSDLNLLEQMKMPTLAAWQTNLPGHHIDFGHRVASRIVAERMLLGGHEQLVLVTGLDEHLDSLKREGILGALKEEGLPAQRLIEYSMSDDESRAEEIVAELVNHYPRVTAIIAVDDSRAVRLMECLRKNTPIQVPQGLSIASLQCSSPSSHRCSELTTVNIDYFEGGKRAAEALNRAFLTGVDPVPIALRGAFHVGRTVAAKSVLKLDIQIGRGDK